MDGNINNTWILLDSNVIDKKNFTSLLVSDELDQFTEPAVAVHAEESVFQNCWPRSRNEKEASDYVKLDLNDNILSVESSSVALNVYKTTELTPVSNLDTKCSSAQNYASLDDEKEYPKSPPSELTSTRKNYDVDLFARQMAHDVVEQAINSMTTMNGILEKQHSNEQVSKRKSVHKDLDIDLHNTFLHKLFTANDKKPNQKKPGNKKISRKEKKLRKQLKKMELVEVR